MGLGLIGKGLKDALFFYEQGAKVTVTDLKTAKQLKNSVQKLKKYPDIKLHLGGHKEADFIDNDIIIRNPAITQDSKFLNIAKKNGLKIFMEDALTVSLSKCKTIGITGTRGKTTTATLIYEILKKAGLDVYLAGNIRGTASLPLISKLKPESYLVLELSSWQLQGFADVKISLNYALILNIYADHLNRYNSFDEYVDDKKNIYRFQKKEDYLFLNQDLDKKYFQEFKNETQSQIIYFSKNDVQDYKNNLLGEHNLENIAAARSLALNLGINENIIKASIENFQPVEFRLQKIREFKGVNFINDSASTAPIAGIKALDSIQGNIFLIAGGASKNLPLEDWADKISQKCQKVALLKGEDTDKLKSLICNQDIIEGIFENLESAVDALYKKTQPGDIILLSPGSASFNMFDNEFDRGQKFNQIVKKIK